MALMDRRRFLAGSAALAAVPCLSSLGSAEPTGFSTLKLHLDQPGNVIPADFIGLSYETEELFNHEFFSASNIELIQQFRALSPTGVLRLGGNTSDVGWWKPTPSTPQPAIHVRDMGGGEPTAALAYPITPESTRNLRGFLEATGWTCIYGINLGTNTPERAADQAAQVATTLGDKLLYFQLGNEPDLFSNHLRDPKTWNADAYFDEWLAAVQAIRSRVPHARFGLPDTSGNPEWYAAIFRRLAAIPSPPPVAALTHHYYFGGPPANPDVSIDRLLQPDPRVRQLASAIRAAALQLPASGRGFVPYRMTEGNTCYRGGKPGVSDVFASAVWAADYLLLLASLGYAGVHLHGGSGESVANSLGGKLPGELLLKDPAAPHPRPFYTPIAQIGGRFVAEPIWYGIKFAQSFAGATIIPVDFIPRNNAGPVNATAYAATLPTGQNVVAIINKDRTQPLHIDLASYSLGLTLSAPALTSTQAGLSDAEQFRESSTVAPGTAILLYETR